MIFKDPGADPTDPEAGWQMADEKVTHVCMEVSSHSRVMGRVEGVEFDNAVFTNLTEDHLVYHKTMDNYAKA